MRRLFLLWVPRGPSRKPRPRAGVGAWSNGADSRRAVQRSSVATAPPGPPLRAERIAKRFGNVRAWPASASRSTRARSSPRSATWRRKVRFRFHFLGQCGGPMKASCTSTASRSPARRGSRPPLRHCYRFPGPGPGQRTRRGGEHLPWPRADPFRRAGGGPAPRC